MKTSRNVLVIESLSTTPEYGENISGLSAEMNASIKFYCSINGNLFRSIQITSEGKGYSDDEALRNAIQNFINGEYYSVNRYYDRITESFACKNIHQIDILVCEPYKSLFLQIFDISSWEIPKCELPIEGSY